MASLKHADTKEIRELANEIIVLANDYQEEVLSLFRRFANVPTITKEWVGDQAEYYFDTISFEKADFDYVGDGIKSYANKLISDCESIEGTIDRVIKEENDDKN